ncbi:hypothetical protein CHCC20335_0121 [Bacillus paralicheniformis]|nr:hypothetical protein CHCC20335_0121 [Bacillus paralicheniformis]
MKIEYNKSLFDLFMYMFSSVTKIAFFLKRLRKETFSHTDPSKT